VALGHAKGRILENVDPLAALNYAREDFGDDLINAVRVLATLFERGVLADGADWILSGDLHPQHPRSEQRDEGAHVSRSARRVVERWPHLGARTASG
jgi:hypothetical protein